MLALSPSARATVRSRPSRIAGRPHDDRGAPRFDRRETRSGGIPASRVKSFKGSGTLLLDAVASGQADCGLNDSSAVAAQTATYGAGTFTVFPDLLSKEPLAYAVRYDSMDLLTWANLFIDNTTLDGRLQENLNYWVNSDKWKPSTRVRQRRTESDSFSVLCFRLSFSGKRIPLFLTNSRSERRHHGRMTARDRAPHPALKIGAMFGNLNTRVMLEYLPDIWQGFSRRSCCRLPVLPGPLFSASLPALSASSRCAGSNACRGLCRCNSRDTVVGAALLSVLRIAPPRHSGAGNRDRGSSHCP
jgi:hypothetical protein